MYYTNHRKICVTKVGQIIVYILPLEGFQFQKDFPETMMKLSLYSYKSANFLTKSIKVPQRFVKITI